MTDETTDGKIRALLAAFDPDGDPWDLIDDIREILKYDARQSLAVEFADGSTVEAPMPSMVPLSDEEQRKLLRALRAMGIPSEPPG